MDGTGILGVGCQSVQMLKDLSAGKGGKISIKTIVEGAIEVQ